jgi:hypothetical protein
MSTIKVDKITGRTGTGGASSPLQLTGDTVTLTSPTITGVTTADSLVLTPGSAPGSPVEGQMYYDSTADVVKIRTTSDWVQLNNKFTAIGGTVSSHYSGGVHYQVHVFTSSGNITFNGSGSVEVLIVAGGGGGGLHSGGGGGAGGLRYYGAETPKTPNGSALSVSYNTYAIVVGAGGISSGGPHNGSLHRSGSGGDGGDSSAFGHTSTGGGGGASGGNGYAGYNGGSGGGGGRVMAGGTGVSGEGFGGGYWGQGGSGYPGGGGGGAGAVGTGGDGSNGGNGGVGLQYSINGTATYYAGGGGGNLQSGSTQGTGGQGGGANGSQSDGINGTANTGGGGGGAQYDSNSGGGVGGSGIVIIRYAI